MLILVCMLHLVALYSVNTLFSYSLITFNLFAVIITKRQRIYLDFIVILFLTQNFSCDNVNEEDTNRNCRVTIDQAKKSKPLYA